MGWLSPAEEGIGRAPERPGLQWEQAGSVWGGGRPKTTAGPAERDRRSGAGEWRETGKLSSATGAAGLKRGGGGGGAGGGTEEGGRDPAGPSDAAGTPAVREGWEHISDALAQWSLTTGPGGDQKEVPSGGAELAAGRTPGEEGDGGSRWKGSGAKPIVRPAKFDGTTDLGDYLNHFDLCIRVNKWSLVDAGMYLGLSLAGQARRLLTGSALTTAEGYRRLRKALVSRYEPQEQEETYKALLRTRERKEGEGLQGLQEELKKYTRLAYPDATAKTIDSLTLDRFLAAVDEKLRQLVYMTQPKDLQEAVMTAVRIEAYWGNNSGGKGRVRAAEASVTEHLKASRDRMDKLSATMEQIQKLMAQGATEGATAKRRPGGRAGCFECGKEGHFKRECPQFLARVKETAPAVPSAAAVASPTPAATGN